MHLWRQFLPLPREPPGQPPFLLQTGSSFSLNCFQSIQLANLCPQVIEEAISRELEAGQLAGLVFLAPLQLKLISRVPPTNVQYATLTGISSGFTGEATSIIFLTFGIANLSGCYRNMNSTLNVCSDLNALVNPSKICNPTQSIEFLGDLARAQVNVCQHHRPSSSELLDAVHKMLPRHTCKSVSSSS